MRKYKVHDAMDIFLRFFRYQLRTQPMDSLHAAALARENPDRHDLSRWKFNAESIALDIAPQSGVERKDLSSLWCLAVASLFSNRTKIHWIQDNALKIDA